MLGTTLWLVVAMGVLATVLLDAGAAFGRAGVHAAADHALEGALSDAVADYQQQLQAAIERGTAPFANGERYARAVGALPNPLEHRHAGAADAAYAVEPTTVATPSCNAAANGSNGPDSVAWLQCHRAVEESRLSLRVVARVFDAGGEAIARREQFVTLRLFAEPPYSAVDGRTDASAADPAGTGAAPAHEGDLGGASAGTLIRVTYECHDGAGSCANAAPPDPDALRAAVPWTNGNRPQP